MIVRIIAMCIAAAMICTALRPQRPEMATAISLAAGLAALAMLYAEFSRGPDWLGALRSFLPENGSIPGTVLKAAGIAVLSQFAAQICTDAGEGALAGRIALAARVAMLGLCAPLLGEITALLGDMLR